jgi:glycosyltransferase involved in cell wall biosynthesis
MPEREGGHAPIGVVIPVHNAGHTLQETVLSVITQSLGDFCCCIVDDGSTDGSDEIAHDFASHDPRVRVIRQPWSGVSVARNRGLETLPASVEYVTFLDADDLWAPETLEALYQAAQRDDVIGAHGLGRFIDAENRPVELGHLEEYGRARMGCAGGRPRRWPLDAPTTFETLLIRCTVFPPGLVLARRDAYERVGGFEPALSHGEDWDMLIRLARLGDLAFLNRVVIDHRRGGASSDTEKMRRGNALVQQRTFWSPENTPDQRTLVRDAWHAIQFLQARDRAQRARRALSERHFLAAANEGARVALAALRYARGRPQRLRTAKFVAHQPLRCSRTRGSPTL